MTKDKQCNCVSEFQDKTYGKGIRAHNETAKGLKCTVCGSVKAVTATKADAAKK